MYALEGRRAREGVLEKEVKMENVGEENGWKRDEELQREITSVCP